jgi:hypothetical protein
MMKIGAMHPERHDRYIGVDHFGFVTRVASEPNVNIAISCSPEGREKLLGGRAVHPIQALNQFQSSSTVLDLAFMCVSADCRFAEPVTPIQKPRL